MFGSIPDIFLQPLLQAMQVYSTRYKVNYHQSQFPTISLFSSKYKISSILKWKYKISQDICTHRFYVKWWDKLKFDHIITQVTEEFSPQKEIFQFMVDKANLQTVVFSAMAQVKTKEDL